MPRWIVPIIAVLLSALAAGSLVGPGRLGLSAAQEGSPAATPPVPRPPQRKTRPWPAASTRRHGARATSPFSTRCLPMSTSCASRVWRARPGPPLTPRRGGGPPWAKPLRSSGPTFPTCR